MVDGLKDSAYSNELFMLFDILKLEPGSKDFQAKRQEVFGKVEWNRFLQLAVHHRVYPILYVKLKPFSSYIPDSVMKELEANYRRNTFEMLRLSAEMDNISARLQTAGIRVLQLKGPALAADLYGAISSRTSADLDIMIDMKDLSLADQILHGAGYQKDDYIQTILNDWKWRHHHLTYLDPARGIKLEVHWRLNPGPGKEPAFEELWKRRRLSLASSAPAYLLGKEDLFMFLVSHGARHGWSRLRWLTDIKQMLQQQMDWSFLLMLLRKYGCLHIGGQALILASELLDASVPQAMRHASHHGRARILTRAATFYLKEMIHLHSPPLPEHVDAYHKRYLFKLMPLKQKLLFLISLLHPYYEDAETMPLPAFLHFLYFPLRPILWTWRKLKQV